MSDVDWFIIATAGFMMLLAAFVFFAKTNEDGDIVLFEKRTPKMSN